MNVRHALSLLLCLGAAGFAAPATGPLRVSTKNPRYFTDGSGKAVYLTGSHVWNNIVDMGPQDPPPRFDFDRCLAWMTDLNHNFIRLWTWELVSWNTAGNNPRHRKEAKTHTVAPHPWARTGPGKALDGKPKFNLERFEKEYFGRLRRRVIKARDRGIYVSAMCFEGWGLQRIPQSWRLHPFNPKNNVNGVNGDVNGDGKGLEVHTLTNRQVTAVQEAYVKKVVDSVNDLDNVLYEIANENHPPSTPWQYHMITFIHAYEKTKPKQHPVGMTFQFQGGTNRDLFASPAEWVSPNAQGGYRDNPPAGDGKKVILTDTDHLWGIGGNGPWVWKSFLRGLNPIFMDPYDGLVLGNPFDRRWDPIRRAMGHTRSYAARMNLIAMLPLPESASTKYCLVAPGAEYLVYNPPKNRQSFTVQLEAGRYACEWFNPTTGNVVSTGSVKAPGGVQTFKAPFDGQSVLYLKAR